MTTYQMIKEQLQTISIVRKKKRLILEEEFVNTRPVETDLSKIPYYYQKFNEIANPDNRDNIKMFVFIVFFMYSPVSCIRRCVRGNIRKEIAKLLRVGNAAVSAQFGDAKVLFAKHKGFQQETERIYNALRSA